MRYKDPHKLTKNQRKAQRKRFRKKLSAFKPGQIAYRPSTDGYYRVIDAPDLVFNLYEVPVENIDTGTRVGINFQTLEIISPLEALAREAT